MKRTYSRLASTEERRNVRRAFIFIVLAVIASILMFFVGIPALGKFAAFVSDFKKTTTPISSNDTTPPAPPKFKTFPDYTNQNQVSIEGTAESGTVIKLTFNGTEKETVSDSGSNFSFSLSLRDGENTFSAKAVDNVGNESQVTQEYKIVFDKKAPEFTIDSPGNGAQFFGSKQRQATIQGTTEVGTQITINDRVIVVDDNGKFQYTLTLSEGENKFLIRATDRAGNSTEQELILHFTS